MYLAVSGSGSVARGGIFLFQAIEKICAIAKRVDLFIILTIMKPTEEKAALIASWNISWRAAISDRLFAV